MILYIRGSYMRPRRFYIDGEQVVPEIKEQTERTLLLKFPGDFAKGKHLLKLENDDGQYSETEFVYGS